MPVPVDGEDGGPHVSYKNPFLKQSMSGKENAVSVAVRKTTIAPGNPRRPYANEGSSGQMISKLLAISRGVRDACSRSMAEGESKVYDHAESPTKAGKGKRAVSVPLLGGNGGRVHREEQAVAADRDNDRDKERGVGMPADTIDVSYGHEVEMDRKPVGPARVEEESVVNLVSDDEDARQDGLSTAECPRSTGVALFDVFADTDDMYYELDERESAFREEGGEEAWEENPAPGSNSGTSNGGMRGLPALVDGVAWWKKMPDFVPISEIYRAQGRDPRDNSAVHVDFLSQFKGTKIASPTAHRGRKGSKTSDDVAGHWETIDGEKKYITAEGTVLTGRRAYSEYKKSTTGKRRTAQKQRRKKKSRG
jgi:hypothetical protein